MKEGVKHFSNLHQLSRHARILSGIVSHLDWDQETYMPKGAAEIRSEQLETLAGIIHSEKTGKRFTNALSKLVDIPTGKIIAQGLSSEQIAAVREWRRDYVKDTALPKQFVEAFTKLSSQAILAWRDAKKSDSFDAFSPFLEKIVSMSQKKADLIGYKEHPYDALLDIYEPDMTTGQTSSLFNVLKREVSQLLKKISAAKKINDSFLFGAFSDAKQLAFGEKLLDDMGYDRQHGRLDLSTHPFSSASHPSDSRITTRIHPTSLISNISIILHEGGHALYEMGLPKEHYGNPLGDAISLGMHESQSRFWETRIGQSKPFWAHYLPLLKKQFPGKLDKIGIDDFYTAVNKVEPSLIRVEADEVTYPLHVILRFELEKALIEGSLAIKDVPEAWNAKMKELLGITPSNFSEGCLQDIHWSMGGFGYFPSYTLGNLYAGQLFEGFAKNHPDWEMRVAKGELSFIKEWLHNAVYQHGRRYSSIELIKKITGKGFSSTPYINYLSNKYKVIYNIC